MDVNGLDLARSYWSRVVAPLLGRHLPALRPTAARLGSGSDVLGLDDAISRDHDWGLRLTLLVPAGQVKAVDDLLQRELPASFDGLPTRFATTGDPRIEHRVEVSTLKNFTETHLGLGPRGPREVADWLGLTGQSVLEVGAGAVFCDGDGELNQLRERLTWYPRDVWCYAVACDWRRIEQELPFVGRTGDLGDEVGSRLITARLVRVVMHLGFLLHRRWAPYPKWFGTLFDRLPVAATMGSELQMALSGDTWPVREAALCRALESLLQLQREVGLPAPDSATQPFFARPYRSVAPQVTALLVEHLQDPDVRTLPVGVGTVEQWVDNVDVLVDPRQRAAVVTAWRTVLRSSAGGGSEPG